MGFTRIENREGDELSESFESFGVAGYGFFCSPLLTVVVVNGVTATTRCRMALHLRTRMINRVKKNEATYTKNVYARLYIYVYE